MSYPSGPSHPPGGPPTGALPGCVRHPDRPTGVRCARCEQPACPECMREASVGYQCVDCVGGGRHSVRTPRTVAAAAWKSRPGRPVVVIGLIVLNVAVFVFTVAQAGSVARNAVAPLFRQWQLVPALVADGAWWRVLTSGFLHFGPLHLLFNMLALYVIGKDLEAVLGRGRFLAVYLVSLLGGGVSVLLFGAPLGPPVAGASGAVFGLMGGLVVVLRRLSLSLGPAVGLIAVNVVLSVALPGISLLGHLGGLVVGAAATAALVYAPARSRTAWQVGALGGLVVLLVYAAFVGAP